MRGAEHRVGKQEQLEWNVQRHDARNQHQADVQKVDAICARFAHYNRGA